MRLLWLFLATMAGAGLQDARAEPELHLIPDGYVGWVTIAYRAPNGEAALYENGARLYRIPATGTLLTQADVNRGISPAWRFFFVTTDGTRIQIQNFWGPIQDTPENRADVRPGIYGIR